MTTAASRAAPTGRVWAGLAVATAGLATLTPATIAARGTLSLASVALLYLVPVVATAVIGGTRPAFAAALAAGLIVNFFFVPPYHTFTVDTRDHMIVLVVYVLVAAAVSVAVDLATRQAAHASSLAEIDRTRTALLAAVGHDLRTPLAGIKAAVSSLRQPDLDLPAAARGELLATVEESADRLDALIDNLLSMSRLQAGALVLQPRPVPLDAVVAQALLLHSGATPTSVTVDVADDLPLVHADPGLLERAIANLVTNALAVSPPNQGVRVDARAVAAGDGPAERIELRIIDHGPGVPATERERIFEPFQRLHDRTTTGGLGLGLAIARGFVEAMQATLTPTETPGGGLTMTISIPVADHARSGR